MTTKTTKPNNSKQCLFLKTLIFFCFASLTFEVSAGVFNYLFDPIEYWSEKSGETCYAADKLREDYHVCMSNKQKNGGSNKGCLFCTNWDKVCEAYKRNFLLKAEDCDTECAHFFSEIEKSNIKKKY
jgi:hypothetical protein